MAVESTFSESLAGRNNRRETEEEEPKRKPRSSVISFPRFLCSGRSIKSRPPEKSRFRCLHIHPSSSSGSSSPEKPSPVQMPGPSPHFMKPTACYDAKKENFQCQGGIECDDVESVDSSNHDRKIKNSRGVRKAIRSFGSTRSFRKGRSSRIMKPSPQGSESSFDSSDQSSQSNMASSSAKSFQTLMRSSSLRGLRISFKSRKATCSSTIKNSKFPAKVELQPGPAESERLSVHRVCSYHHCSLNGHSHDSSSTPAKRIHPRRRWSNPRIESTATKPINGNLGIETSEMSPAFDPSVNRGSVDAALIEIIFGETSFPEKNYKETLNQIGKTADWCCTCNSSKPNAVPEEFRELESKNPPQVVDSEAKSSSLTPKEKNLSMWNLIHHHMVSGLTAGSDNELSNGSDEANKLPVAPESSRVYAADSCDAYMDGENQEIEARKLFAIKVVREAIEKILLPEVPDQSSDDQSITTEILENNKDNASAFPGSKESESSVITDRDGCQEEVKTMKSEKKAPKHWSNLKKWILLQRFIKELEKVKKMNPRESSQVQAEHDAEAEKVHLRPQVVDEKRRTEEWMLDYALQQAITQLVPTQRRKVELLVRAFETVVPPQRGNSNIEVKSNSEEHLQMQTTIKEVENAQKEVLEDAHQPEVCGGNSLIESMAACKGNNGGDTNHLEKRKYISMWHMISQHVLSGVVSKAGTELLDGTDDEAEDAITVEETKTTHHSCLQDLPKPHDDRDAVCENLDSGHQRRNFSRDDAIKLVREVVNEILVTQVQDDSSDTQSVTKTVDDSIMIKEDEKRITKTGVSKSKNWSKLKKLLLLKRSIMALESARKLKFPPRKELPQTLPNPEAEKVDLRHQMVDERKKAEEWMLDYAVQNIVTKLTPARKRRVAMLVEAFESVVPLPEV